ncbi:hypothetical protein BO221_23385 [Archangium sp. Cb G35]|uniref:hypothetical protein n=1 Tax=Archangium sp. Cb G35 TaxID=1920190 RepID=UPI0009368E29|nr:hypothetical protein [Archangium sp. Cb G35]OJT22698.1 hypothetical protein BO221_23385 [Archangium sp. Cb G35]
MRVPREPRNPLSPIRVNDRTPPGETAQVRGRRDTPEGFQRNPQEGTSQQPRVRQPALEAHQGRDGFDSPTARFQRATPVAGSAAEAGTLPIPAVETQQAAPVEGTAAEAVTLPAPVTLNLTGSVGNGGINNPADVRQVQDRLRELGYLSDANHSAEQVDAAGTEPITTQAMPQTMEALLRFQKEVVGASDGNISPSGPTAFSLADPTYGTQSTINPRAADPTAGLPVTTLPHPVAQIAQAIEAAETGNGPLGEKPALLRNGSGTPASFGKGQLIGGTALGVLAGNPEAARHYGLDDEALRSLQDIATATREAYTDIYERVPAGGDTEAGLQSRIAEYTGSEEGTRFREETGLGDEDIENMFRTAQLRRQMAGVSSREALLANPDAAANVEALGLGNRDLNAYLDRPAIHGEHREGFITRALLSSEHGQALRDAMTDNGGIPMSRLLIQENYEMVTSRGERELGRPLTGLEAAQATMIAHNGPSALDNFFASLRQGRPAEVTPYVTHAMEFWRP